VLETHAHADHLSGAQWLKKRYGAKVGISARVTEVQGVFKDVFGLDRLPVDGRQFDVLLEDKQVVQSRLGWPSQSSRRRATRPRA
jgi:glyoxylase-like metal-dependent hydrolase (beta-lactamase superfamily II)